MKREKGRDSERERKGGTERQVRGTERERKREREK